MIDVDAFLAIASSRTSSELAATVKAMLPSVRSTNAIAKARLESLGFREPVPEDVQDLAAFARAVLVAIDWPTGVPLPEPAIALELIRRA